MSKEEINTQKEFEEAMDVIHRLYKNTFIKLTEIERIEKETNQKLDNKNKNL